MISSFGSFESCTRSRTRRNTTSTISPSGLACPGGFTAACRHCTIAPELVIEPFFSMKNAAGSRSTSVWIVFGIDAGTLPERRRLGVPDLLDDEHLELLHAPRSMIFRLGDVTAGFCPTIHSIFICAGERALEDAEDAVVLRQVALRQPLVAEVVLAASPSSP